MPDLQRWPDRPLTCDFWHKHMCVLQITFWNVQQLMDVKRELMPALRRNKAKSATRDAYSAFGAGENSKAARTIQVTDFDIHLYELAADSARPCSA